MADTDDRVIRIEEKLDRVVDHLGSIDTTLAAQHVSLKEHIRRSDLLEAQLEPIKVHVNMVSGVLKFIGLLAAAGAGLEGIIAALKYLGK
jgi:hypothetical protein